MRLAQHLTGLSSCRPWALSLAAARALRSRRNPSLPRPRALSGPSPSPAPGGRWMTCASLSPAPLGTDFTPLESPPTARRSFRLAWLRRPHCPVSLSTYFPRRREEEWSRSRGYWKEVSAGLPPYLRLGSPCNLWPLPPPGIGLFPSLHPNRLRPSCSQPPHTSSRLGPGAAFPVTDFQNQARTLGKTPKLLT